MDSRVELLLARSDNELLLADRLKVLTEDERAKDFLKIPMDRTFYSAVISHAYYSIFYAAKAMLLTKGIITASPDVHKKTFPNALQSAEEFTELCFLQFPPSGRTAM